MGKGLKLAVMCFICALLASCASKRVVTQVEQKVAVESDKTFERISVDDINQIVWHEGRQIERHTYYDSVYWVVYDTKAQPDSMGNLPVLAQGGKISKSKTDIDSQVNDSTITNIIETDIEKSETHTEIEDEIEVVQKKTQPPTKILWFSIIVFVIVVLLCRYRK